MTIYNYHLDFSKGVEVLPQTLSIIRDDLIDHTSLPISIIYQNQIVAPIYFSINHTYNFLYAGATEIDGKAIAFMASSFAGKSTLTNYFIQRGHQLITDDKMATYESDGEIAIRKLKDLYYKITCIH